MDPRLLARSLLVGLAVAAPVGPIGILVIKRSLTRGRLHGFATGLGAATADAVFALAGALGLGAIVTTYSALTTALRIAGGLFLVYLGTHTLVRPPKRDARIDTSGAFVGTFLLTLSSPVTVLSFAAIASSLGIRSTSFVDTLTLVGGVFVGSAAWWAFLSASVARFRTRIPTHAMRWLDRGSAVVLIAFGAAALLSG